MWMQTTQRKIYKEGLANLFAEWDNTDQIPGADGTVKDKLTMKLTPEMTLKYLEELVMTMLIFLDLVLYGHDQIGLFVKF